MEMGANLTPDLPPHTYHLHGSEAFSFGLGPKLQSPLPPLSFTPPPTPELDPQCIQGPTPPPAIPLPRVGRGLLKSPNPSQPAPPRNPSLPSLPVTSLLHL